MIEFRKYHDGIYRLSDTGLFKIGTVGKSANKINYERDSISIRNDEKTFLKDVTGIDKKNILMLNQVHGDSIVVVDKPPETDAPYLADADGMITDMPGICLVIRTADCVPVVAYDRKKKIFGAVHSGWKGCRLSISRKLIIEMKRIFSCGVRDVNVFLLPSIGPDFYPVNEDVASYFKDDILRKNSLIYLNLWSNIARSLCDEGVPEENIFNACLCTMNNSLEFFSHRNKDKGRNLNFCCLPGGD